jgi:hypothetical protein
LVRDTLRRIPPDAWFGALGLVLVAVGVALIYVPAALIVVGAVLLALAVWEGR